MVGAGFGGLQAVRTLKDTDAHITVIDRSNHHLFQPLLYQVATTSLSPAHIAYPIRSVLRDQKNVEVLMAEVVGIDKQSQEVLLHGRKIPYDWLVVATGARQSYFNHGEWEKVAPGLKSIADATLIRQKILTAFEQAEMEPDAEKRSRLLHFILVGGGPTGVEMAGAIAELAHRVLATDFRRIDTRSTRITLIEAGDRILGSFPEVLSHKAAKELERLGTTIITNSRVTAIDETGVYIGETRLYAHNVIWTAGVAASPAGEWLKAEVDRAGRVKVSPELLLPGHENIFVIGDTAAVAGADGNTLPGIAPVAMQQGRYVGHCIKRRLKGEAIDLPFRYRDKGNLATIGRGSAVAELGSFNLSGAIAWVAWVIVHIYYLIGFHNRLMVVMEWGWAYFTVHRGARLIVNRFAFAFALLFR